MQQEANGQCSNAEAFAFDLVNPLTQDGRPATIDGVTSISVITNEDGSTGGASGVMNVDGLPTRFAFNSGTLEEDETTFSVLVDVKRGPSVVNIELIGHLSVTPNQAATVDVSPVGPRPKIVV